MAKSPLSPKDEVANSANAAQIGFENRRYKPSPERIQYLFRLENKLEENIDEFTRTITLEFGTFYGQASHAVEFFTQTKIVIERWPKVWSRKL